MVTIQQVRNGLAAYVDREIMPNLPVGTGKRLLVGTYLALAIKNIEKSILAANGQINPLVSFLGVIDENHNVDIDSVLEELKKNIPDEGIKMDISAVGMKLGDITFHRADIDSLRNYIVNS